MKSNKEEINKLRKTLENKIKQKDNLLDEEILKLSQELDQLILNYHKSAKSDKE